MADDEIQAGERASKGMPSAQPLSPSTLQQHDAGSVDNSQSTRSGSIMIRRSSQRRWSMDSEELSDAIAGVVPSDVRSPKAQPVAEPTTPKRRKSMELSVNTQRSIERSNKLWEHAMSQPGTPLTAGLVPAALDGSFVCEGGSVTRKSSVVFSPNISIEEGPLVFPGNRDDDDDDDDDNNKNDRRASEILIAQHFDLGRKKSSRGGCGGGSLEEGGLLNMDEDNDGFEGGGGGGGQGGGGMAAVQLLFGQKDTVQELEELAKLTISQKFVHKWRWFVLSAVHLRFADSCDQQEDAFHAIGLFPFSSKLALGEGGAAPGAGGAGGGAPTSTALALSNGGGAAGAGGEMVAAATNGGYMMSHLHHSIYSHGSHHSQRFARPGDRPTRRATLFGSVVGVYRSAIQVS